MVVGYRGELLRDYSGDGARHGIRIEYLSNPRHEEGNAISLYTAKAYTQEEVVSQFEGLPARGSESRIDYDLSSKSSNWRDRATSL